MREQIKLAALDFCADAGLTRDEMISLFHTATTLLEKQSAEPAKAKAKDTRELGKFLRTAGGTTLAFLLAAPLLVGTSGGYMAAHLLNSQDTGDAAVRQDEELAHAYQTAAVQARLGAELRDREKAEPKRRRGGGLVL